MGRGRPTTKGGDDAPTRTWGQMLWMSLDLVLVPVQISFRDPPEIPTRPPPSSRRPPLLLVLLLLLLLLLLVFLLLVFLLPPPSRFLPSTP